MTETQITNMPLMNQGSLALGKLSQDVSQIRQDTTSVFNRSLPGLEGENKMRMERIERDFQTILAEADAIIARFGTNVGEHGENVGALDRKLSQR